MSAPSVSVAMATYNGAEFLGEQLRSIAEQSLPPLEVVICDDGSTDQTPAIARDFAERSSFPVRFHANPSNLGYTRNFRKAASLCSGELIAFCDQDDWWLPERLEVCVAEFGDPEVRLLYHNAWLIDRTRRTYGQLYDAEQERSALALKPVGPWNHSYGLVQIFRSNLRIYDDLWDQSFNHIAEPLDILSHDQWYFYLAEAIGRVIYLDQPLLEYRQHGSNSVSAERMRPAVESRLLRRLEHYGTQDLRMAKAAEARGAIMREIATRLPERAARLADIAGHYEKLAERHRRRFRTYCARGAASRLKALVESWCKGDYAEWPWGFNRLSIIRDLWSGVAMASSEPAASTTEISTGHLVRG